MEGILKRHAMAKDVEEEAEETKRLRDLRLNRRKYVLDQARAAEQRAFSGAAARIQALYRGKKCRDAVKDYRKQWLAARNIQKVVRGKFGRRRWWKEWFKTNRVVPTVHTRGLLLSRSKKLRTAGDWEEYRDQETNAIFYYQPSSGETQWDAPSVFEPLLICTAPSCDFGCVSTAELELHYRTHSWYCPACDERLTWESYPVCPICKHARAEDGRSRLQVLKDNELKRIAWLQAKRELAERERLALVAKRKLPTPPPSPEPSPPSEASTPRELSPQWVKFKSAMAEPFSPSEALSKLTATPERPPSAPRLPPVAPSSLSAASGAGGELKASPSLTRFPLRAGESSPARNHFGVKRMSAPRPNSRDQAEERRSSFTGGGAGGGAGGPGKFLLPSRGLDSIPRDSTACSHASRDSLNMEGTMGLDAKMRSNISEAFPGDPLQHTPRESPHVSEALEVPPDILWSGARDLVAAELFDMDPHPTLRDLALCLKPYAMDDGFEDDDDEVDVLKAVARAAREQKPRRPGKVLPKDYVAALPLTDAVLEAEMERIAKMPSLPRASLVSALFRRVHRAYQAAEKACVSLTREEDYARLRVAKAVYDELQPFHTTLSAMNAQCTKVLDARFEKMGQSYELMITNGVGAREFPSGARYEGNLRDGLRHGEGCMTYGDGSVYTGEWKDGVRHGKGSLRSVNGMVYSGDWVDGIKNGFGILYNMGGTRYEGQFKDGKPHGSGELLCPNGDRYIGQWADGLYHGQGEFVKQTGHKYSGQLVKGQAHGIGTLVLIGREKYRGEWANNRRNGRGICVYDEGGRYVGSWKDDKPHGLGKYTTTAGDCYIGMWKEGRRCGKATQHLANGDVFEGTFVDGYPHGKGEYIYRETGNRYSGDWKRGQKHGLGTLTFGLRRSRVGKYVGNFRRGFIEGKGVFYYEPAGDVYIGYWVRNMRHGRGHYKWANGNWYKGDWLVDKAYGIGTFCNELTLQKYTGSWVLNRKQGHGTMVYSNGDHYTGEWKLDRRNGYGRVVYNAAIPSLIETYEGYSKNGVRHGYGVYVYADGSRYEGNWEEGVRSGAGKAIDAAGNVYEGEFQDDMYHGKGKFVSAETKESYDGDWVKGIRQGQGVAVYPKGDVYTGAFLNNLPHGKGVLQHSDGSEFHGEWQLGERIGHGTSRLRSNGPYKQPLVKVFGY